MVLSQKQLVGSVQRRRWLEILAGLIIGIVGGTMLLGGLFGACLIVVLQDKNAPVVATALVIVMGAPCPFLAWRLITGRMGKEDGGLFSPTELRVAGICFALSPLIAIGRFWSFEFFEWILGSLSLAVACFALASRRANTSRANLNGGDLASTMPNIDQPQGPASQDQPGG